MRSGRRPIAEYSIATRTRDGPFGRHRGRPVQARGSWRSWQRFLLVVPLLHLPSLTMRCRHTRTPVATRNPRVLYTPVPCKLSSNHHRRPRVACYREALPARARRPGTGVFRRQLRARHNSFAVDSLRAVASDRSQRCHVHFLLWPLCSEFARCLRL
jgi:hypothetical protein